MLYKIWLEKKDINERVIQLEISLFNSVHIFIRVTQY